MGRKTLTPYLGFPGGSVVKNPPAVQENWVCSLGGEDPMEKGKATHSSILTWRIPWKEEPGGLTVHRIAESRRRLSKPTLLSLSLVLVGGNPLYSDVRSSSLFLRSLRICNIFPVLYRTCELFWPAVMTWLQSKLRTAVCSPHDKIASRTEP